MCKGDVSLPPGHAPSYDTSRFPASSSSSTGMKPLLHVPHIAPHSSRDPNAQDPRKSAWDSPFPLLDLYKQLCQRMRKLRAHLQSVRKKSWMGFSDPGSVRDLPSPPPVPWGHANATPH
ncbi:hypothetical protein DNTS_032675 [Danionella cerebrum]|uniref:Uncharacterized protein n=1 Tax=Danionella cerebrum TaxID=2873325 RepID=A0A553MPT2_9TELE|nr:hypothetical protein DNTS_032675 [Danionella translucida]